MILGRITGTVTSTAKHDAYAGRRLLVVQPIDESGAETGAEFLAVDHAQSGVGDTVLVLREGNGVRQIVLGDRGALFPVLELVVAVVDEVRVAEIARR